MVKNLPANAGDAGDTGLIPGWEDHLKKEMATHSSILAWRIPINREAWQVTVCGDTTDRLSTHTAYFYRKCILSLLINISLFASAIKNIIKYLMLTLRN